MSNPAMELLELFNSWDTKAVPRKSRGFSDDQEAATLEHFRAMELLVETQRALEELSGASMIAKDCLKYIPSLTRAVIALKAPWGDNTADSANFHEVTMNSLLHAAHDMQRVIDENEKHRPEVESLVREINEVLVSDKSISGELKAFINELLNSIRSNMSRNGLSRDFDFGAAMNELWVALIAAQSTSVDEKTRWSAAASHVKDVATGFLKYGAGWAALGFQSYSQFALGSGS